MSMKIIQYKALVLGLVLGCWGIAGAQHVVTRSVFGSTGVPTGGGQLQGTMGQVGIGVAQNGNQAELGFWYAVAQDVQQV